MTIMPFTTWSEVHTSVSVGDETSDKVCMTQCYTLSYAAKWLFPHAHTSSYTQTSFYIVTTSLPYHIKFSYTNTTLTHLSNKTTKMCYTTVAEKWPLTRMLVSLLNRAQTHDAELHGNQMWGLSNHGALNIRVKDTACSFKRRLV